MDKKVRILQLGKFHPIKGGVEKVMYAFMLGLSSRGIACDMLCASDDDEVGVVQVNKRAKLIKVKTVAKVAATMLSPDMVATLRRICRRYDIIHIHLPDPMAVLALMLSGYKGKVVIHWHSDILKQKLLLQLFKPLQAWVIRRADLILGTTPVYVEQSPALRGVQHKIDYLPIGVRERAPEPEMVAMVRNQYPGKKIIYSMGRLVEYKGYEYLIEAASLLPNDYIVLIGGSGPLKGHLQDMVQKYRLQNRVFILGFIPREVESAYYGACDVFCLSSTIKTEAYAIVQVEAMSCGRPIIATNIPGSGVPWVNAHGVSGLNVEPCSSKEIAIAAQMICEDGHLYERFSMGALYRYHKLFTQEAMINGLIAHYDKLLTDNKD